MTDNDNMQNIKYFARSNIHKMEFNENCIANRDWICKTERIVTITEICFIAKVLVIPPNKYLHY